MDCPKCIGKLQKTTIKTYQVHDVETLAGAGLSYELELDQCFICKGVWLDKGELDKYLKDEIRIVNGCTLGQELNKDLDRKIGRCPCCNIALTKQASPIDPRITIDVCNQCHGIWLDHIEINLLESSIEKSSSFLVGLKKMFFS